MQMFSRGTPQGKTMESIGRSYSRHFSAFLVDEEATAMPSQPVSQPRPSRPVATPPRPATKKPRALTEEDIPVLGGDRKGTFCSDGEDDEDEDDDDDDDLDDDDDGDDEMLGRGGGGHALHPTENLENVPVLQTSADLQAFGAPRQDAAKKTLKKEGSRSRLRQLVRRSPKRARNGSGGANSAPSSPFVDDFHSASQTTHSGSNSSNESYMHGRPSLPGVSNTVRQMVRSGWLIRQSQHLKTWKRRYFVLLKRTDVTTGEQTASLQYYKGSNFGKLRGEIDLHEGPVTIRFVDVSESKKPFCFEITRGDFSLYCQGKDDEDVSAWVWHLQSLAAREDAGSGSPAPGHFHSSGGLNGIRPAAAMGKRGIFIMAELRRLLHNSKSPEASKCKNFVKHFEYRNGTSLRQLRDLHSQITDSIMKVHGARIIAMTEEKAQAENLSEGEPLNLDDLRTITSRHVEEVLYLPVQDQIATFLRRAYAEDESVINRKLRWLQGKDQTYYNIPLHQVSWKEWRKAAKLLSQAASATLPTVKYELLVATMNEIRVTYAEEHDQLMEANPLETDDLIPIFTYVLANSGLDNLLSLRLLLSELNGSWAVGGSLDNGAALSVFRYAVDFIGNVSIPAVLEDIFKDQITLSIDGEWRHVLEMEVEPTYRYGAIVRQISQHGFSTIGTTITRGFVLVTINGQNVVLWPYTNIAALLKESTSPHRLAFIPANSYFKILTSNKALWNVALVHACQRGDIASVQMLLANGADVNYVAHECGGNTPLHIAVSASHFNVVSYILQHGAKARTLGEYGRSSLHMVGSPCTFPSPSMSSTVLAVGNSLRQTALSKFRPSDKVVMIIKKLLNHGAAMESTDIFGHTPLMLLAQKGLVNGIDVLVEMNSNMDMNARNWQHGMSALAFAAREGHQEAVEALLDYGVQPDMCNLRGDSSLHFAAAIASKHICRLLIERGCDVDMRNRDGLTPLMAAVSKGFDYVSSNADAKRHLTRPNAHVDDASVFETIDYLIAAGADMYAVCSCYRLPLHYAAMYGGADVFDYLKRKMAADDSFRMRDLFGKTPLLIAEESRAIVEKDVSMEDGQEDDMERPSEMQMFINGGSELSGAATDNGNNIITEEQDGKPVIVAGTLDAINEALFRCEDYMMDEAAAMIRTCNTASYRVIIEFLRACLNRHAGTSELVFARRMVLHALDLMVQSFTQNVELDAEVCSCIYEFCSDLFPFKMEDDPQCGQWLATSLLPTFAEAARMNRMYELRVASPCEASYSSLRGFLRTAKLANPTLRFLDDELFASTFGMEVITESMRRRLSIAGVWNGEASKSYIVRPEGGESPYPSAARKTLAAVPLPRSRSMTPDRHARIWLLEVDVSVLAQQITLFQHYLFSQIRVSELLESKKSAEKTPAYDRLRQLHNHVSVWVVNQVLSRDDVDQRAQILAQFIKVAGVCLYPLQNFDGFMAIMNATNDSSVFRLKKTWGRLPPQVREQWHDLKKYTENGARSLHKLMRDATPPVVPYLGSIIQNVIAIQEFPDRIEGDLVNFKKIRVLGELVKRFTAVQASPYLLPTEKRVLDQICGSLQFPDAETCFDRSLKVEPRIPTS